MHERRIVRAVVVSIVALVAAFPAAAASPEPSFRANRVDLMFYPVTCSPDGMLIAAAGNPMTAVKGTGVVPSIMVSPERVSVPILLFDARNGQQVGELGGQDLEVKALAFSPDGKRMVSCGGGSEPVRIWDVAERKCVAVCRGHTDVVTHVAYSRDGKRLASTSNDGTIRLWDPATGKEIATLDNDGANARFRSTHPDFSFTPDSTRLLAGGHGRVTIWDLATRKVTRSIRLSDEGNYSVAISPDGKMLAASGADERIRLVDLESGRTILEFEIEEKGTVPCLAFSPDGKTLAAASDIVRLWDVATGACRVFLRTEPFASGSVAFSPDGQTLFTAGWATIRGWPVAKLTAGGGARVEAFLAPELAALRREGVAQQRAADTDLMLAARATIKGREVLTPDEAVRHSRKKATVVFQAGTMTCSSLKDGAEVTDLILHGGNPNALITVTIAEAKLKRFKPAAMGELLNYYQLKWVAVTGDITVDSVPGRDGNELFKSAEILVTAQSQIVVLNYKAFPVTWLDYLLPPVAPAPPPVRPSPVTPVAPPDRR
jgi:dipeptidyl aminopeptidase/acylaminoacyl peptidase